MDAWQVVTGTKAGAVLEQSAEVDGDPRSRTPRRQLIELIGQVARSSEQRWWGGGEPPSHIQGGATEVFVRNHLTRSRRANDRETRWREMLRRNFRKGSTWFHDWFHLLVDEAFEDAKQIISDMGDDASVFTFQAVSVLATNDSTGQAPHFDLDNDDYQFILALHGDTEPTRVLGPDHTLKAIMDCEMTHKTDLTPEDVCDDLQIDFGQLPDALKLMVQTHPNLMLNRQLLANRMIPAVDGRGRRQRSPKWNTGTVLGMKGSVLHNGPASAGARYVLFFVACRNKPDGSIKRYNADFQVAPWALPDLVGSKNLAKKLSICRDYVRFRPWDFLPEWLYGKQGLLLMEQYSRGQAGLMVVQREIRRLVAAREQKRFRRGQRIKPRTTPYN